MNSETEVPGYLSGSNSGDEGVRKDEEQASVAKGLPQSSVTFNGKKNQLNRRNSAGGMPNATVRGMSNLGSTLLEDNIAEIKKNLAGQNSVLVEHNKQLDKLQETVISHSQKLEGIVQKAPSTSLSDVRTKILEKLAQIKEVKTAQSNGSSNASSGVSLQAQEKKLSKELNTILEDDYIPKFADCKGFEVKDNESYLMQLNAIKFRLKEVMRASHEKIIISSDNLNNLNNLRRTAYYSVHVFSMVVDAISLDEKSSAELTSMFSIIRDLTNAFNAISGYELEGFDVADMADVNKRIAEITVKNMDAIKTKAAPFLSSKNDLLKALGKGLMIIGIAMFIATAAIVILSALGVSMPAFMMSYMAMLNATFLVSQAVTAVATLAAVAGVQMSAATATASTAAAFASTVTLFGKAAHTIGSPGSSPIKKALDEAADDIKAVAHKFVK